MPRINKKYGISDYISRKIQREIKRRCGFGCVICGNAIVTFEHFDPRFADMKIPTKDASGITLLCFGHQGESAKGLLSKKTIADRDRDPVCLKRGYSNHVFDLGSIKPKIILGTNDMTDCGPGIKINGMFFLKVNPPEKRSNRWQLSCLFRDKNGNKICEIDKNELRLMTDNIDIEQTGTRFCIRSEQDVLLELEIKPPHTLVLQQYCLYTENGRLFLGEIEAPDIQFELQNPGQSKKMIKRKVLRFETLAGGTITFSNSIFVSGKALNFKLDERGLSF